MTTEDAKVHISRLAAFALFITSVRFRAGDDDWRIRTQSLPSPLGGLGASPKSIRALLGGPGSYWPVMMMRLPQVADVKPVSRLGTRPGFP